MEGVNIHTFPTQVCLMLNLEYLNMSFVRITSFALSLGNISKPKYLCLQHIQEIQEIPEGVIAKLQKLKALDLSHRLFAKHIPSKGAKRGKHGHSYGQACTGHKNWACQRNNSTML